MRACTRWVLQRSRAEIRRRKTTASCASFHPCAGTSPSDFQSKLAQPFCAQLLRLTGDSEATCKVAHVVATAGRRLLQVCGRSNCCDQWFESG